MRNSSFSFKNIGPGLVLAATGLGAGDLIAASVAGAKYGTTILWAAVLGAIMKFAMNEGLTRWQLATGTTLLEGWVQRLPKFISIYFFIYLVLWSFIVAGALIAGTGLAAHALYPEISVAHWGIMHSLLALALVIVGRYKLLESLMKFFMGLMLIVVIICAILVAPGLTVRSCSSSASSAGLAAASPCCVMATGYANVAGTNHRICRVPGWIWRSPMC